MRTTEKQVNNLHEGNYYVCILIAEVSDQYFLLIMNISFNINTTLSTKIQPIRINAVCGSCIRGQMGH